MERITILDKSKKKNGNIKIRFRLRDGRDVDITHRTDIIADVAMLRKQFAEDGTLKPRVSVYDQNLLAAITARKEVMHEAYEVMKEKNLMLTSEVLTREVERILAERDKSVRASQPTLVKRMADVFAEWVAGQYESGVFGTGRKRHYEVLQRELCRFLVIRKMKDITVKEFDGSMLYDFSLWLRDEWRYVEKLPDLYEKLDERRIPREPRSGNTVATKMKLLRCFFRAQEFVGEVEKTPFNMIDGSRRKAMMREKYDTPVSLTGEELKTIVKSEIPQALSEVRDTFVLHCFIGCRVNDLKAMMWDNVAVADGVPFIHYVPQKTAHQQGEEVVTPLMRTALEILKKYDFKFYLLRNLWGKDGYNHQIKTLLEHCGIKRKCPVRDGETGKTKYVPIHELASTKLARKTFVNLMASCQVDLYAAGLHKRGSDAVERYAHIDLKERFRLMCFAFGEPEYEVDDNLAIIERETVKSDDKVQAFLDGLNGDEMDRLLEMLKKKM
jgi:integrase